jgi:hypothetical protein
MAPDLENYRAINAERLLDEKTDLTIDRVIKKLVIVIIFRHLKFYCHSFSCL